MEPMFWFEEGGELHRRTAGLVEPGRIVGGIWGSLRRMVLVTETETERGSIVREVA
jgi:hypothetical protein